MSLDYYTSERFIHDDLVNKAQHTVDFLFTLWRKEGKIAPVLLTWPAEPIKDDSGNSIDDLCGMELPTGDGAKRDAILHMVERTKAYALLLVEPFVEQLKVILETPHGTKAWSIPIHWSGDVKVLGTPKVTIDQEFVGLLWRPQKGEA